MNQTTIVPFVLDRHDAHRAGTHYDLRIKYPDKKSLASWAIPKAQIPSNGKKLLAIRTPDHDMIWLSFQGQIGMGEDDEAYGAGVVSIEQRGWCEILTWSPVVITFRIKEGHPMVGKYSLTRFRKPIKNETWLFFKSE